MKRRQVLLGAAAAGAAGLIGFGRPRDHGAPYNDYFRALNEELQKNGPMRPCMVIDLDLMDRNLGLVIQSLKRGGKHLRIVEKTLQGGYWQAEYESPKGLQFNNLIGHSANQEIVNGSPSVGLQVGDNVFMRPVIIEGVLLQFGDLVTMRGGRIQDYWPVYHQTG